MCEAIPAITTALITMPTTMLNRLSEHPAERIGYGQKISQTKIMNILKRFAPKMVPLAILKKPRLTATTVVISSGREVTTARSNVPTKVSPIPVRSAISFELLARAMDQTRRRMVKTT